MPPTNVKILYLDNHLLVVNKPAGLATMGAEKGEQSLVDWGKKFLKEKFNKPGNVFLGVVSRLDSFTSGVIVLARTSKAASRLSQQFRDQKVGKIYLAASEGELQLPTENRSPSENSIQKTEVSGDPISQLRWQQTWTDWVYKDDKARRMRNAPKPGPKQKSKSDSVQKASLQLSVLAQAAGSSLSLVKLQTGRKHQIRLQLSSRGTPVFGDRKYDGQKRFPEGIALHCLALRFLHPTTKQPLLFCDLPPKCWTSLGTFQSTQQKLHSLIQKNHEKNHSSKNPTLEGDTNLVSGTVHQITQKFLNLWDPDLDVSIVSPS